MECAAPGPEGTVASKVEQKALLVPEATAAKQLLGVAAEYENLLRLQRGRQEELRSRPEAEAAGGGGAARRRELELLTAVVGLRDWQIQSLEQLGRALPGEEEPPAPPAATALLPPPAARLGPCGAGSGRGLETEVAWLRERSKRLERLVGSGKARVAELSGELSQRVAAEEAGGLIVRVETLRARMAEAEAGLDRMVQGFREKEHFFRRLAQRPLLEAPERPLAAAAAPRQQPAAPGRLLAGGGGPEEPCCDPRSASEPSGGRGGMRLRRWEPCAAFGARYAWHGTSSCKSLAAASDIADPGKPPGSAIVVTQPVLKAGPATPGRPPPPLLRGLRRSSSAGLLPPAAAPPPPDLCEDLGSVGLLVAPSAAELELEERRATWREMEKAARLAVPDFGTAAFEVVAEEAEDGSSTRPSPRSFPSPSPGRGSPGSPAPARGPPRGGQPPGERALDSAYVPELGDAVDAAVADFVNLPQNRFRRFLWRRVRAGFYLYGTSWVHMRLHPTSGLLEASDGECHWGPPEDLFLFLEQGQSYCLQRALRAAEGMAH